MQYAEIEAGQITQLIETNAALPAHKLRANLLPVEDVTPDYDPATQVLGAESLTVEAERVVRTWAVDAAPPPPVPESVSAAQARAVLLATSHPTAGTMYDAVDALMQAPETTRLIKVWWEYEPTINRDSEALQQMATLLGITSEGLDDMFRAAGAVRV